MSYLITQMCLQVEVVEVFFNKNYVIDLLKHRLQAMVEERPRF